MLSDKKIKASTRNLNVFYRSKQVLKDVNLDIYSKSVTSLIGSSGCGKSTLLRCFNRMNDFVDDCKITGEIIIDNQNICAPEVDVVLLRTRVGMVFQKPNPFPKSIYDNVAYGPRLQEVTNKRGQLDEIVQKSLIRSGLWEEVHDNLHQNAMELSGGQQQRLCIARAIAVKPTILLMDEPCSALDPKATKSIESLIIELKKKFTIIVVTHSMKQARSISDMVAYIEKGRVIEYGETEEVFRKLKGNSTGNYFTTND